MENGERRRRRNVSIQSYRELDIWQRSMDLAEEAYRITRQFPKEEMFGLTSQIRRSAASVPANIAEGWGRGSTSEFRQFLRVAQGSLRELETRLLLSSRVGICPERALTETLQTISILGRQIITLQRRLAARQQYKNHGKPAQASA